MGLAACIRTGESGNVAAIPTASPSTQTTPNTQSPISNSQSPISDNNGNSLALQELDKPPERPLYVLNVNLDYDTGVITAQQRIEFVNPTGVPIDEIKFSVPPARRANALTFRDARIYRAKQPLHFELNGPVLTVKLPATLQPGKAIAITFDFSVAVPLQEIVGAIGGDDTSRGPNNLTAGHWYLVLPPYKDGAWDLPEYAPVGDPFTSELADFEVNIFGSRRRDRCCRWRRSARRPLVEIHLAQSARVCLCRQPVLRDADDERKRRDLPALRLPALQRHER